MQILSPSCCRHSLSPPVPLYAPHLQGTEAIREKVVISAAARDHF